MKAEVKHIELSPKPHRLADATVELVDNEGDVIVISDIRVLENKQGQKWVAMPSRSVSGGGRSYQYIPQVELNRQLQRKVEDAVLAAFEQWQTTSVKAEVR